MVHHPISLRVLEFLPTKMIQPWYRSKHDRGLNHMPKINGYRLNHKTKYNLFVCSITLNLPIDIPILLDIICLVSVQSLMVFKHIPKLKMIFLATSTSMASSGISQRPAIFEFATLWPFHAISHFAVCYSKSRCLKR
jgi:hypothetical protein